MLQQQNIIFKVFGHLVFHIKYESEFLYQGCKDSKFLHCIAQCVLILTQ